MVRSENSIPMLCSTTSVEPPFFFFKVKTKILSYIAFDSMDLAYFSCFCMSWILEGELVLIQ